MMKQNGNTSEQSERGLLPYVVIVAATKGDPEAMKMVVQHYEGYISYLSTRTLKDERGCNVTRSVSKMTEIERRGGKRWDKPKKAEKSRDCGGGKF